MNPSRKPPASVTAAGVIAIIGSVLSLLGASLIILTLFVMPTAPAGQPPFPNVVRNFTIAALALFAGLALFGIFTGAGVLRLKNWARISVLVWSGITAAICAFVLAFLLFIPLPTPANAPTPVGMMTFVRILSGLFYGVPLGIAIWWLVLFNKKAIAAQFLAPGVDVPLDASGFPGQDTSQAKPALPLPITVLAVFLLMSAVSLFFLPFLHLPLVLFGYAVRGSAGTVAWIATCLVSTATGIGLLCRKRWSYPLALGMQLLWFVSGVVTLASPRYGDLMREAMSSMTFSPTPYPQYSVEQLRRFSYGGLVFPLLIAILLLYYRSRFLRASASRTVDAQAP